MVRWCCAGYCVCARERVLAVVPRGGEPLNFADIHISRRYFCRGAYVIVAFTLDIVHDCLAAACYYRCHARLSPPRLSPLCSVTKARRRHEGQSEGGGSLEISWREEEAPRHATTIDYCMIACAICAVLIMRCAMPPYYIFLRAATL